MYWAYLLTFCCNYATGAPSARLVNVSRTNTTTTARAVIMATYTGTAEQEALKLMFSYLVNSINTDDLLPAALSKQLITERQRLECFSEPDLNKKAEKFLGHLQRAVNGDSENFHIFVQLLNESGQTKIASRLLTQGKRLNFKIATCMCLILGAIIL